MHKVSYLDHNWLAHKMNNEYVENRLSSVRGIVYDLGCGTRPYEKEILRVAKRYIGVDWSNTLHGLSADVTADLNKPLPIASEVADNVISLQVMEHLCEPQVMLNEAFRILKPGGRIDITVPFQWWIHEVPYDYFRYTFFGLQYLLNKAGFVDVVVEAQSGFFTMWILKMNYFSTRLLHGPKPLQWLIRACLIPFWYIGQRLAPILDKLDRHWEAETCGYCATAKKLGALSPPGSSPKLSTV